MRGVNLSGRPRGGRTPTCRRAPTDTSPVTRTQNGFQAGYASKSVSTAQTASGGAAISRLVVTVIMALGSSDAGGLLPVPDRRLAVGRNQADLRVAQMEQVQLVQGLRISRGVRMDQP